MWIALKKVNAPGMPLWERCLARLIDACTGRHGYFHCELRFQEDSFTADPERGVTLWRHTWAKDTWTFFQIGGANYDQIRAWCRRQVHDRDPYSFVGCAECVGWFRLITWPLRNAARLVRRHVKPLRHHAAHYYCSLVVFRAVRPFRPQLLRAIGWDIRSVPPNLLATACERAGYPRTEG